MIYFENGTFYLESKNVSYIFRVAAEGFLQHLYFGGRIAREDISYTVPLLAFGDAARAGDPTSLSLERLQAECPTYGRGDFRESMLAFDFGGTRLTDLKYIGHSILKEKPPIAGMPSLRGGETLKVVLEDSLNRIQVALFYTVYEDLPVIARRAEITANVPVTLDRAYSFSLDLPDNNFSALTLHGAHMRERIPQVKPLGFGTFKIDSTRGISSAQTNPFFAALRPNTDEEHGEVYAFQLIYSGDFCISAQSEQLGELRISGGINSHDFAWRLNAGETFATPEAVLVYSDTGLGAMSRAFHDLYRSHLIDPARVYAPRPVVINNWESTYFDFDTKALIALIDSVKGTGIDTFVLDDGWFGARNNDFAGLGDWRVNEKKVDLPRVIAHAHAAGMKFGIWIEPEMVNPDSDLYRAHPDWAIHAEGLSPCLSRNQLVLDFTRQEVVDYISKSISRLLTEYEIDYIKWDMNRCLTENTSSHLKDMGKETHHRYVLGVYTLCERLVRGFPNVFFEGCASGGARFDPAMLAYFPQIWTSDNSDAYNRALIQYGTSYCYPLSAHSCHVSHCPNHQSGRVTPFKARADIAHLGATGYELDPRSLKEEERAAIRGQVEEYHAMEELILKGDLYRLHSPFEGMFAEMVVSKDKTCAHLTVMRPLCMPNDAASRVFPRGLAPDVTYEIASLGIKRKGKTLMQAGLLLPPAYGDFTTLTYNFRAISE